MIKKLATLIIALTAAATVAACDGANSKTGASSVKGSAFIVTTDRETGSFAVVDVSTRAATQNISDLHSDAVAGYYEGLIYVLNRLSQDNVQVLDPSNNFSTIRQFSTGAGSNPYDIAFASDTKAYVTRYEAAELWIVNPATGEYLGAIDLSSYADADGMPEMAMLHIKGGRLYVAIQALDRNSYWAPSGASVVAVIDTSTDSVITSIQLPFQNPTGDFIELSDGRLAIACAGNYLAPDGGLVIIDPVGETAVESALTESLIGGDIGAVALVSDTAGFAVITDSSFNTILIRFDISAGSVETVYETQGFYLEGLALNGLELWVADRTAENPGVRIFDANTGAQVTSEPISVGLPPSQILFIE